MSKTEQIRKEMMQALKDKDMERKETLTLALSALKARAIDKRADLTEQEEDEVILRELKQTRETLEAAPAERAELIAQCQKRIAVLEEFAPKFMDEAEIEAVISDVLEKLGLPEPTAKDKGMIMKNLMPLVKGKADGALVNRLVAKRLG